MSALSELKSQKGLWLFVVPVSGIKLLDAIGQEITIDKITFVGRKKLPAVRKRLGFPLKISEIKSRIKKDDFFDESEVYAVAKFGGSGKEKELEFLETARDELDILSLSQLGFGRRRRNACLSIANENRPGSLKYFMMNTKEKSWSLKRQRSGKFMTLELGSDWKRFQKLSFFERLLDVVKGKENISTGWQRDIKNAAVLAGKSQSSTELPHAFLWNMIAIETLLTHRGDSYSTALPQRVESFIGWTTAWAMDNFAEKISEVYTKRCAFVHSGKSDQISISDLLFTDIILVNVLYNILVHLDIFYDKNCLIDFSKKVEAEHILGVKPRVRPGTISFINMSYSDPDYERL
ncbi:hypothetical protein [Aquisalimonas sp.]|uniref:hypothetical protein n=1 Tax=Aquisalimonas sp. TaxID=1872621 RepID=UPI0025BC5FB2|nr:hypothetical protein [Aquisalimonas sp.]